MRALFIIFPIFITFLFAQNDEEFNTKIPDEKIRMINGEFSELKNYVGEGPLLLEFWTTWCPNCPKQMGYLSDLAEHFKEVGLQVLGINLNEPKIVNKVKPYIQNRNFSYDIAIDPEEKLGEYFRVEGIPTLLLIDNEGNVINRYVGYSPGQEENYVKDLSTYFNDNGIDYIPISLKEETIDLDEEDISIEF
jgi:thiol-disulfide isomerase/thioredoxin